MSRLLRVKDSDMSEHASEIADIDLPWRKIKRQEPEAIRDDELLAVVLRNGYGGRKVLSQSASIIRENPPEKLVAMHRNEIEAIQGISPAKADILTAAIELAKRGLHKGIGIMPAISTPKDVLPLLSDIKDQKKEHFVALYLNARNQVISREIVSVGSLNASLVHPREVFAVAVLSSAASLILCHNHPSGDVAPSREDIDLTRRMRQAGDIMGIEVIDHLIVGSERFLSMREANLF